MYKRLIVIGMIMLMELSLSQVWASAQSSPSWRRNSPMDEGTALPDYRFRSTSPLLDNSPSYAESENSSVTYGANYGPRRGYWKDGIWYPDDEDNPIGEVGTPVGEPLCLLLMAAAWSLVLYRRKKQSQAR